MPRRTDRASKTIPGANVQGISITVVTDGADDKPLRDPPEQRLFPLAAAGNQIEKKGDGQKERHVIDEIKEMPGYHCFSTSCSVFAGTATAAFFTTTRLRPPAFAS